MLTLLTLLALSASKPPSEVIPGDFLSLTSELAAAESALRPQEGVTENAEGESPFSYTFVEIGATRFDVDEIDDEADIYSLRGSLGLFDFLYLFAGYENQATDFEDTDTDVIRLGAGLHFNVIRSLDLIGDIAWLYSDMSSDLDELDDTTDGFEIHAGGRWLPLDWDGGGLEIHGGLIYVDLENRIASDDEATGFDLGAKLHFLRMLSVGAVYTMLEDDDSIGVNARVSL
jgi:hypothetical protein